jgi:hypothetical protein
MLVYISDSMNSKNTHVSLMRTSSLCTELGVANEFSSLIEAPNVLNPISVVTGKQYLQVKATGV